ncbi:MAG: hypothetical protein H6R15_57 [Proteobacteria bacterium]|nr:hypothetical protein [Pseudomonadota bacterium]
MTAIGGIVKWNDKLIADGEPERLMQALRRYGPDAQHLWKKGPATLLRTLRRFTPEDSFDRQPLISGDKQHVFVFCGRLDNRDELASALAIEPARLRGLADSALALAAYTAWGEASLRRLVGDFAFAAWSPGPQRLFLARDPLGMRPLYWHQSGDFLAFASAASALHALPEIPCAVDEERLAEYLALLPHVGASSFYAGIQRVEPGHFVVIEQARSRSVRYHQFDLERRVVLSRDEDYVAAFREHLETAVRCRLRGVGEIGAHLSSGFDSSTICAVAAPQLAARNKKLLAFTAVPGEGFSGQVPPGRHGNEGPAAAALVARYANIEHVLVRPNDGQLDATKAIAQAAGYPFLNPSNAAWMNQIGEEASLRGARIVLTGLRGNMGLSFEGMTRLPCLVKDGEFWQWFHEARALHKHAKLSWKSILSRSFGPYLPEFFWVMLKKEPRSDFSGLFGYSALHPMAAHNLGLKQRAQARGLNLSYRPRADGRVMRTWVLNRFDVGDAYLSSVARTGVVERAPAADLRLLEFCLAIPENQFFRNGQTRSLLLRAFGDRLPPEIVYAKSKGLQAADWYETTGRDLPALGKELERLAASPAAARLLDIESLRSSLKEWPAEGWAKTGVVEKYQLKLLRGLSVGAFIRHVEGGNE